ncbi:MAG: UDP-N-acetylmuramate dehydrogenase [Bradymonadia bacterium]
MTMYKKPTPQRQFPLATCTSFGTGGAAEYFWFVDDVLSLPAVVQEIGERGQDVFVLGGGSNLVVSDAGVAGHVLTMTTGREPSFEQDVVIVDAGFDWDRFVALSIAKGRSGVELMSGIPGRVGGAPIQNIGAYGQEISSVVEWVEVVWLDSGEVERLDNRACGFRYRDSVFKREFANRLIVTRVAFRLLQAPTVALTYKDLVQRLGGESSPKIARTQVLEIRREKGMTLDHGFGFSSAGSFFMNPVVSEAKYLELVASVEEEIPNWSQEGGKRKLAGAWLIEKAGFKRGTRAGSVGVSPKHALSIVNFGDGCSEELLTFAVTIQQRVQDHFGIWLTMEPVIVGREVEQFMRLKSEKC